MLFLNFSNYFLWLKLQETKQIIKVYRFPINSQQDNKNNYVHFCLKRHKAL